MIPPGGEGEIKVTLRPKGGHAEIDKKVVVVSNDPEQPQLSLTMKGRLLVDMAAVPSAVSLANLAPGEPGLATVSLERDASSVATVKSVRIEDTQRFSLREIETRPGALATYEIRFAGGKVGTTSTKIVVETTGEHTPTLTIPVRASAAYNLVYPKRVTLTKHADGTFEQTIRLATRRGDPPQIVKIEDPDGLLDLEVLAPVGPAVNIHARVKSPEALTVDEKQVHQLWVHTNDPDEPKVAIAYSLRTTPSRKDAPGK